MDSYGTTNLIWRHAAKRGVDALRLRDRQASIVRMAEEPGKQEMMT